MGVFTGSHINKVDKKGRVSVPKTFRVLFEDEPLQGVYVFPSFRQSALEACPESFMERIVDSLEDLPMFSDEQDDLSIIIESAQRLAFDGEGRIVLPDEFRADIGIKSDSPLLDVGAPFRCGHQKPMWTRASQRSSVQRLAALRCS